MDRGDLSSIQSTTHKITSIHMAYVFTFLVSRKSSSRRVSFIGRVKSSVFQPFQPGATSTPLTKMKRAVSRPSEFFRTSSFSRFGSLRSKKGSSETSSSVNLSGISHAEDAFNDSHFAVPVVPTSTTKNDSRRLSLCEKKMEELKEKEESTAKEEQKEKKMSMFVYCFSSHSHASWLWLL